MQIVLSWIFGFSIRTCSARTYIYVWQCLLNCLVKRAQWWSATKMARKPISISSEKKVLTSDLSDFCDCQLTDRYIRNDGYTSLCDPVLCEAKTFYSIHWKYHEWHFSWFVNGATGVVNVTPAEPERDREKLRRTKRSSFAPLDGTHTHTRARNKHDKIFECFYNTYFSPELFLYQSNTWHNTLSFFSRSSIHSLTQEIR